MRNIIDPFSDGVIVGFLISWICILIGQMAREVHDNWGPP